LVDSAGFIAVFLRLAVLTASQAASTPSSPEFILWNRAVPEEPVGGVFFLPLLWNRVVPEGISSPLEQGGS